MNATTYMNPSDLLESRTDCMTLRSIEAVNKTPMWWKEVSRRMKLRDEHIKTNGKSEKVPIIMHCPDCDKSKTFPEHLVEASKNPVKTRCQNCQDIFDKGESEKYLSEKIKSEELKTMVEASEREKKFFDKLPASVVNQMKTIDISDFTGYGYRAVINQNDLELTGYNILLSFFMSGMDRVELTSHVDLMNKIKSADKDISGLIEFYKSRELLIVTNFNSANDSDNTEMQIKNIILNRSFAKAKTFVLSGTGSKSTIEINFFDKFKGEALR